MLNLIFSACLRKCYISSWGYV